MKDTKVFVDLDDEITFVAEKILKSQTNRVILVVPERSGIISSQIGLKMLKKVVDKNDKDIILVTMDEKGRNIATASGFISLQRIGDVTEETWKNAIDLKKRLNEASKLSRKEPYGSDIYAAVDNLEIKESIPETHAFEESEEEKESLKDDNIEKLTLNKDPKIFNNSKKVSLEGFDLLVGGDIASDSNKNEPNFDFVEDKKDNFKRTFTKKDKVEEKKKVIPPNLFKSPIFTKNKNFARNNKIIVGVVILILLVIFIIYFLFLTKANITILMKGNKISGTTTIIADPNISSISPSGMKIPSSVITATESGSQYANTTGTKTVSSGSYATGTVTLANYNTSQSVTVPQGTVLTATDGYTCTTDSSVSVPQQSSPISAPGTVNVNVTAQTNTAEGQGKTWSVQGISNITGYNQNAFSAGNYTSKTEQVVSAQDQTNLENSLSQKLFQEGDTKLTSEVGNGLVFVPSSVKNVVINTTFDNQPGTVAQVLNLSEQTKSEGQAYSKANISKVLGSGLTTNQNTIKSIKYTIKSVSVNPNGTIQIDVSYSGIEFKNLNTTNIISKIKGKSFNFAKTEILKNKGAESVKIVDNPSIFSIFGLLPAQPESIKINIKN